MLLAMRRALSAVSGDKESTSCLAARGGKANASDTRLSRTCNWDVGIRSAANMDQFARRTSCSEPQTLHRLRQARLTQQTRPQRQLAI